MLMEGATHAVGPLLNRKASMSTRPEGGKSIGPPPNILGGTKRLPRIRDLTLCVERHPPAPAAACSPGRPPSACATSDGFQGRVLYPVPLGPWEVQ